MPLLQYQHASLSYGNQLLWQGLDFAIEKGEFVALLGANGVGKTSLFKSILGLEKLSAGEVSREPNLNIGYVPQLKALDPKLPIRGRDLVQLGLDGHNYGFGLFSQLPQLLPKSLSKKLFSTKTPLTRQQKNAMVEKALYEVGGNDFANMPLTQMSGGQQQRMRIAQALVAEPDLLLLDEPLLSLDMQSQQVVCDILAHRKQYHDTAILMITHELLPVVPLIDKVIYIYNQQADVRLAKDFFNDTRLPYAYLAYCAQRYPQFSYSPRLAPIPSAKRPA